MTRPAVFFDRDNTLIISDEYLGDPAQVKLVAGAADAIARARKLGYAVVTFSNQSGVARGLFEEKDVQAVNARMDQLLREQNPQAIIEHHEYCPFHPQAAVGKYREESNLRKPKPGMLLRAADVLKLDLKKSWVVGDAPRDIEAGHAAGCRTILFTDPSLPPSPAARANASVQPEFCTSTLNGALDVIESNPPKETDSTTPPTDTARLETLAEQILTELRRRHEAPHSDFSITKLLAGMVQILALASLFLCYLNKDNPQNLMPGLMVTLILQTLTIALLLMTKQK